jgi:predicted  nucleic acid-binding Zn-ribbon protein
VKIAELAFYDTTALRELHDATEAILLRRGSLPVESKISESTALQEAAEEFDVRSEIAKLADRIEQVAKTESERTERVSKRLQEQHIRQVRLDERGSEFNREFRELSERQAKLDKILSEALADSALNGVPRGEFNNLAKIVTEARAGADEAHRRLDSFSKASENIDSLVRNLGKQLDDFGGYIDRDASYLRRHGETLTAHVERFVRLEGDMNEVKGRIDEVMRAVMSHDEGASKIAVGYLQTFDGIANDLREIRDQHQELRSRFESTAADVDKRVTEIRRASSADKIATLDRIVNKIAEELSELTDRLYRLEGDKGTDDDDYDDGDEETNAFWTADGMLLAKQIDTLRMDMGNLFTIVDQLRGDHDDAEFARYETGDPASDDYRDEREVVGSADDPDLDTNPASYRAFRDRGYSKEQAAKVSQSVAGIGCKIPLSEGAIDFDQAGQIQQAARMSAFRALDSTPPATVVEFGGELPSGEELTITVRVKPK